MNIFDNSSHSSLLQSFIDGDIDPYEEQTLFAELAMNSELRAELREHMQIGALARADAGRMIPSGALYEQITGSLGIAASARPVAALPQEASRRHRVPLVLASALAGALIVLLLLRPTQQQHTLTGHAAFAGGEAAHGAPQRAGATVQAAPAAPGGGAQSGGAQSGGAQSGGAQSSGAQSGIAAASRTPERSNTIVRSERSNIIARSERAPRAVTTQRSAESPAEHSRARAAATAVDTVREISATTTRTIAAAHPNGPVSRSEGHTPAIAPFPAGATSASGPRFAATLRGFRGSAFPDNGLPEPSNPVFSNVAVGLDFAVDNGLAVGIEVGQEPLPQTFTGTENQRTVEYRQRPLIAWAAARLRGNTERIWDGLAGYGSIGLGGTQVGPILRAEAGIEYGTGNGVALVAGLDASLLAYRFGGDWFTTRRLALSYGARVRF